MPEVFSVSNVTAIYGRNATLHCPFDNIADGHRVHASGVTIYIKIKIIEI